MHVPAMQRSLSDVVAEYDAKAAALEEALRTFEQAGNNLKMAVTIGGTFGRATLDTGRIYARELASNLLTSAWLHVYEGLNIAHIASPADKRRFEQSMATPAPFSIDNIRATFGDFIKDPRGNILRGLAEVFCELDQAYKSHDKVKIGVAGLPKRVVMSGFGAYSSWGKDRVTTVLNALAMYQGKPLVTWREVNALLADETALLRDGVLEANKTWSEEEKIVGRGIRLRRFQNGNGHLFFEPDTLRDINKALAEFYGDVLPDTTEDRPDKPAASTAVSKDLQYYPTPVKVAESIVLDLSIGPKMRILEPSCGCGRLLDAVRRSGGKPFGIEVDASRAAEARAKGHPVQTANFLETVPTGDCDLVLMNSPFYGRHYEKHVRHALKYLKPGGQLVAILPITARYDHGLLDDLNDRWGGNWHDLPVGSFSESGTNINITILKVRTSGG